MLHARPYSRHSAPPRDPAPRLLIVRLLRWWDCRANPKSRVRLSQQCWFAFCAAMMRDVRALSNRCCETSLSGEQAADLEHGPAAVRPAGFQTRWLKRAAQASHQRGQAPLGAQTGKSVFPGKRFALAIST